MELNEKTLSTLSLFNENKILILLALYKCKGDVCGCDMVSSLNIPKNLLSYHIKTLREAGYIKEVKCGKNKKYEIAPAEFDRVESILKILELI